MEDFNAEFARGGPFDCAQGAWAKPRIGEPVEPSVLVLQTDGNFN